MHSSWTTHLGQRFIKQAPEFRCHTPAHVAATFIGDFHAQNDARTWRHRQLQAMARTAGCSVIALGHTATDRAETLLLNLVRWDWQ